MPSPQVDRTAIRVESPDDYPAVRQVVCEAFGRKARSPAKPGWGETVAHLVVRIRSSPNYVRELALVAVAGDRLIGHVMLSYVALVDADARRQVLTLSPVSVAPEAQRQGIGAALITAAIEKADRQGEPLIVLEGSPRYYLRFGFQPASGFGITIRLPDWAPEEAAMVLPLSGYDSGVRGEVVYPSAFDLVTADRG
jgi:putative acetyltransferase